MRQGGGFRFAGTEYEVRFEAADGSVLDAVDDAFRTKYAPSPYLEPMLGRGPRGRYTHGARNRRPCGGGVISRVGCTPSAVCGGRRSWLRPKPTVAR
ncbi:hypothetical protein ACF08O_25800 [Streptomyces paradoxus]|uniref:hypothetical protein n=1 Tax=Streptomyces paradoxus TaxID=66375 RepID=UPI0036FD58FB